MSQMCPNCSADNPDDAKQCSNCPSSLRGLLGSKTTLSERYQVVSVLGCGAMGAVYLAEDQRLVGRRCALKENRPDPNATVEIQAQSREQFLAEASVLARLDHPSLPKVSDYFIENDREYLVMDYVEGEDLESRLQRYQGPLPEADVVNWADQVLDSLTYLHNQRPQPIIHRDIKPANLRVNLHNRVKLVDFGLVKLLDSRNPETKMELRGLGTPAYAPLEQFASSERHTDARSDIYALGATMYHLLTNLSPPDVHQRLLNPEILLPPRELNPQLSEQTEQAILQALEIHPNDRFQNAADMRQTLTGAGEMAAASATTPARRPKRAQSSASLWMFGLIGLIFVLLILGVMLYLLFGRAGSSSQIAASNNGAQTEQPSATPTQFVVQALGDAPAPTETSTPVIAATTPPAEPPTNAAATEETDTPTPQPTAETPTPRPQTAQSRGIPAATLAGTIAYPVFNGADYDLYFGQADGSGTRLFQTGASQPAFSHDGARIAYRSWRPDQRGIVTADISGNNPLIVASFFEDQLPTWTADNTDIVFLSRRSGDRKSQLFRVNSFQRLGQGVVIGEGEYPTINPTGLMAFKGWGNTGTGLRASTANLENVQALTDANEDTAPAPSPDGQKIAFMSRRAGNWEIYVVNADGLNIMRLTENGAQDGLPTWSPDGQAIAFVSDRDGQWAVWAMTPTGADQRQLFPMQGSPDGFVGADRAASRGWAEERISWTR